jgi:hypothetical protein
MAPCERHRAGSGEARELKEVVGEQALKLRLLKKRIARPVCK